MQALLLPFTPRYIALTLAWLLTFAFAAAIGGSMLSGWDVPLALGFCVCLFLGALGIRAQLLWGDAVPPDLLLALPYLATVLGVWLSGRLRGGVKTAADSNELRDY